MLNREAVKKTPPPTPPRSGEGDKTDYPAPPPASRGGWGKGFLHKLRVFLILARLAFGCGESQPEGKYHAGAQENNVNFYIYASGKRSSLKGSSAKVASGAWQELTVEVTGNQFKGFLNGTLVVEATDDAYKVGRVGLWTKADSITCFDNVRVTAK